MQGVNNHMTQHEKYVYLQLYFLDFAFFCISSNVLAPSFGLKIGECLLVSHLSSWAHLHHMQACFPFAPRTPQTHARTFQLPPRKYSNSKLVLSN